MYKYSGNQLDIVYKTDKNHMRFLNRKHIVDRHALQLIHTIGESV